MSALPDLFNRRLKLLFPAAALLLGLAYAIIVPPFQVPDEYMHFARALNLLSGHARVVKNDIRMGYQIDCRGDYFIRNMPHDGEYKGTGKYRWADFYRVVEEAKKQQGDCFWEIEPGSMQMHVPYLYVPQAIGIFLARKFSGSIAVWLYTGRIFNLAFCVWLLSLALRFMRGSPLRIIYFMSLPMFLHLAGSLSGDAPAISFAFLFFSLVIHALAGDGERARNFWWITGFATFFLGVGKSVYFPLVILLWLIPLQTRRREDWLRSTVSIAATLAGLLLWNFLVRNDFYRTQTFPMDPAAQTQWLLAHPFAGIKAVFLGFIMNAQKIAVMYFGVFGWLSVIMPLPWYLIYFAVGLLALLIDGGEAPVWQNRWTRPAFILIPFGIAVLLSLVMFITFTPVGFPYTKGIQGRHLMPVMPFIAWAIFTRGYFAAQYGKLLRVVVAMLVFLNIWALFAIYRQFN